MSTLTVRNLHVSIEDKEILKGVDLTVSSGEIHALMGPNGNGKSTLLMTIMGHPDYRVTEGEILLDGENVLEMSVDERSRRGLFMAFQYPSEIPGVTNSDFMKAAVNAHRETPVNLFSFIRELDGAIDQLQFNAELAHRSVNEGFSGGEKKRNEILQMKMLRPDIAMLDEIDSGLDVDAMKIVADNVNQMIKDNNMALIIVSHYDRFFTMVEPQYTHVLVDGRIIAEGDGDLARLIDEKGYEWYLNSLGIEAEKKEDARPVVTLGSCAVNQQKK